MPWLFQPIAGVQTNIYIFEVNKTMIMNKQLNLLILEMMDINEQVELYKEMDNQAKGLNIIKNI